MTEGGIFHYLIGAGIILLLLVSAAGVFALEAEREREASNGPEFTCINTEGANVYLGDRMVNRSVCVKGENMTLERNDDGTIDVRCYGNRSVCGTQTPIYFNTTGIIEEW